MSTRPESLERVLHRRAMERLSASATLYSEFLEVQNARRMSVWTILFYGCFAVIVAPFMLIGFPLVMMSLFREDHGRDALLAMQSMLTMIAALYLASAVSSRLKSSRTVSVSSHLPLADGELARKILLKGLLFSLPLIYFEGLVYGQLAYRRPFHWIDWSLVVLFSSGQWMICLATALILIAWFPKWAFGITVHVVSVLFIACVCLTLTFPGQVILTTFLIMPSGWINAALSWSIWQENLKFLWTVIPLGLWCVWGVFAWFRVLARYRIGEFRTPQGTEMEVRLVRMSGHRVRSKTSRPLSCRIASDHPEARTLPAAEARDRVRSRDFLLKQDWSQFGWLERLADRLLSNRERVTVEFLTGGQIRWSQIWWTALWISPLVCILLWSPLSIEWLVELYVCIPLVLSGPWPAFRLRNCGGTYLAQISGVPVGLDDVGRTLLKVGVVRTIGASILLVPIALLLTAALPFWPWEGIQLALATCVVTLVGTSWIVFGLFGMSAEFPHNGPSKLFWYAGCLILFLLTIGGAAYFIFGSMHLSLLSSTSILGLILMLISTLLNWLLFRAIYHRGAVDLVLFKNPESDQMSAAREQSEIRSARRAELLREHGWFWWLKRDLNY